MNTAAANTASLPPTEVFYAGTHTDVSGRKITFTSDDLAASSKAYDPALFAAPLVIGHPTMDAPAFGWVNKLPINEAGRMVSVDPTDVHPEFAALVVEKRFPRVSMSFFDPKHPSNPVPGVWYPRHIGYLGGAAPALSGLKVANFTGSEDGVVTFGGYDDMTVANLWRSIKNFFLTKFPTDAAAVEAAMPEWQLSDLTRNAVIEQQKDNAEVAKAYPNFSANGNPASLNSNEVDMSALELKAAQDAAAAEKTRADAAVAKLAQAEATARSAEFAASADALVKEGKLHPDERDNYVAFMAQPDDRQTVEFSAADGTAKSFNARDFLSDFIKRRAPLVEMKEVAKGKAVVQATADFSAPDGVAVDSSQLELHARAKAYAAEHNCSFIDALRAVR